MTVNYILQSLQSLPLPAQKMKNKTIKLHTLRFAHLLNSEARAVAVARSICKYTAIYLSHLPVYCFGVDQMTATNPFLTYTQVRARDLTVCRRSIQTELQQSQMATTKIFYIDKDALLSKNGNRAKWFSAPCHQKKHLLMVINRSFEQKSSTGRRKVEDLQTEEESRRFKSFRIDQIKEIIVQTCFGSSSSHQ